jgi:hypothetical protein
MTFAGKCLVGAHLLRQLLRQLRQQIPGDQLGGSLGLHTSKRAARHVSNRQAP